jgi:hypothetical protein
MTGKRSVLVSLSRSRVRVCIKLLTNARFLQAGYCTSADGDGVGRLHQRHGAAFQYSSEALLRRSPASAFPRGTGAVRGCVPLRTAVRSRGGTHGADHVDHRPP